MFSLRTLAALAAFIVSIALHAGETEDPPSTYKTQEIEGWSVSINEKLYEKEYKEYLDKMMPLFTEQLKLVVKLVPEGPLEKLKKIKLWINPPIPGVVAGGAYHPSADWLRANHRDANMARGIEFTNIKIFDFEVKRMPVLALHELAHAYHDQVLGFKHPKIIAAYKQALESKTYDKVERINGPGRPNTTDRAYAMSNEREYFAENTEAFFAQNDFYPFNKADLEKHDPTMFALLKELWKVE